MQKHNHARPRGIVAAMRCCIAPPPLPLEHSSTKSDPPIPSTPEQEKEITPVPTPPPTPPPTNHVERGVPSTERELQSQSKDLDRIAHSNGEIPFNISADIKLTLAMFTKAVTSIGIQLLRLANEWDAGVYEKRYEYADYPSSMNREWPILPRHVVSLPKAESFTSKKIARVVEHIHEFIRAQMPLLARLDDPKREMFADVGHDAFRAFFNSDLFPMPRTILDEETAYWTHDDCYTDQFLNGCNPTVISRVTERTLKRMPEELKAECDPLGRDVITLLNKGLLYAADYSILATPGIRGSEDEKSGSFTNNIRFDSIGTSSVMVKHFYAPYIAFYQHEGKLGILGIVLTRHKSKPNAVYNSRTCEKKPNTYIFAKMHVACSDNQYHQFYSHLGRCHLVFEPFGVAIRNVFDNGDETARKHIVGRLLSPHFKDHIAINWLARQTLVSSEKDSIPFSDAGFAVGATGGLTLLAAKYAHWKLEDQSFPNQLIKRGIDPAGNDGLKYYYRDDGMRVWQSLKHYVVAALTDFYESTNPLEDIATEERHLLIRNDKVLKEWCTEMRTRNRAAVRSFPEVFTTVDQLAETITTIMYNVTAEHSAVNYSQRRYLSYVPNRPNSLFKPVPLPCEPDINLVRNVLMIHRARGDDDDIGASQPLGFAMFQVQFSHLLSALPEHSLLDLKPEGVSDRAVEVLRTHLTRAHYEIHARNLHIEEDTPHLPPYEFLDPKQIAQSIEI